MSGRLHALSQTRPLSFWAIQMRCHAAQQPGAARHDTFDEVIALQIDWVISSVWNNAVLAQPHNQRVLAPEIHCGPLTRLERDDLSQLIERRFLGSRPFASIARRCGNRKKQRRRS